jgi:tetratricopeptide (TPR) repeat protein
VNWRSSSWTICNSERDARHASRGTATLARKKDPIESLIEKQNWPEARRAILRELKNDPDNHWLLTRLSTTFYEEGDYATALEWVEKARQQAPTCPLVLWDYAGTLDMLGREREALAIYRALVQRGAKAIAEDECGEGLEWAMGLLTDCVYRAGKCSEDLGDRRRAADLYRFYLSLVDMGAASIYPREEAVTRLRHTTEQPKHRIEQTLAQAGEELVDVL